MNNIMKRTVLQNFIIERASPEWICRFIEEVATFDWTTQLEDLPTSHLEELAEDLGFVALGVDVD